MRANLPATTTKPTVALLTDHIAVATGQVRWWSGNGGLSTSWDPNEAHREMADGFATEVWHVDGVRNITDSLSRDVTRADAVVAKRMNEGFCLTPLSECWHPYLVNDRPEYFR